MLRNVRLLVLAGLVLGCLALPGFAATTVIDTTYNFNAADNAWTFVGGATINPITVTGTGSGHLANGATEGILGAFGNSAVGSSVQNAQIVRLTINSATAFDQISLSFQLWTINTWDGNGGTYGNPPISYTADYFSVVIGGSTPNATNCTGAAMCNTFSNNPPVQQSYPTPGSAGGAGSQFTTTSTGAPFFTGFDGGAQSQGYSVYNIALNNIALGSPVNSLTIYFRGLFNGNLQSGADESWALANARIVAVSNADGEIPEPSTIALGGLGLALLAFAKLRRKKA